MLDRIRYSIETKGLTADKLADLMAVVVDMDEKGKITPGEVVSWMRYARSKWMKIGAAGGSEAETAYDQIYECYRIAARYNFDDYMSACEFYREPQARFWWPRRKVLEGKHRIASQIQEFIDSKEARYLGFSMPPGTGKALADDTPILTRNGWKNHGDLVVGDEVIGMNGEFKKVIAVHPKCMLDRLVEFSNGEKIQCHARHEWLFYDRGTRKTRLKETQEWEKRSLCTGTPGKRGHRYVMQLPHRKPVIGEEKDLPLDPYTLGVWLGDGANKNPRICNALSDKAIIDRIVENGIPVRWQTVHKTTGVYYYDFDIRGRLQSMGMCHSRWTFPKRIPEEYLTASIEQRLQLLAGLIDTDGCLCGHKYHFTTAEETLRDSVMDLISTFGWRCYYMTAEPVTSTSGVVGRHKTYTIGFCPTLDIPCALERKRTSEHGTRKAIGLVSITKVEPKQGNCITVEGDGMYLAGRTMVPTHNTTLIKFLLAYIAGRWPDSANMYVSYSDGMVKMILDAEKAILTNKHEYKHNEIFHNGRPAISSEYKTLSYRMQGDFPTLGLVALGGSVTGRTRANRFLVTDDLVKNAEEARSPERLDKLFADYKATLTTRMIGDDVKQIQLGTIWSVYDPISRMKAEHEGDPRYRFIAIPVCDEDGHSNFLYEHPDNYTDEKIAEIRAEMDPVDFSCLYMQQGIQKEGLAFQSDTLSYYNGVLPPVEPDKRTFFCDVAFGGGDSLAMPIAYIYGDDIFIEDVIFDRNPKDLTEPRVTGKILHHKCHTGRFEANNGGDFYADDIGEALKKNGYHMNITTAKAPTTMSKVARIEQYAPDIRKFHFLEPKLQSEEYKRFMAEVCSFSFTSKNLHDDAPDSLAGLAAMLIEKPKVITSPFRRW